MKNSAAAFFVILLLATQLHAELKLVPGARYLYNGVAACTIMGVGGAGIRIKFDSGKMENLSMDDARSKLSDPSCKGASLQDTKKQLAFLDELEKNGEIRGPTHNVDINNYKSGTAVF